MNEPTRLFDCIEQQLQKKATHAIVAAKENGSWKEYSIQELSETVNQLSAGLLKMGLGSGDRTPEGRDKIAVIAKNRPEWLILDLAVQQIGAVLTPVYPTISESELEYILQDAQVKIMFVNDSSLAEKVNGIRSGVPCLREIYSFEKAEGVKYWKDVLTADAAALQQAAEVAAQIQYEDLVTIIYTSGTTGKPKGVMLSHRNIVSNVNASMPYFPPGNRALSFLPMNHIFERMVTYLYLFKGVSIYYAESMETIGDNLKEVKPHMFTTVPRLLEKVYERIMTKGDELTGIKRKLFFWANDLAEKFEINRSKGFLYNFQLGLANKIVFSKWREGLGNELNAIISGGAACPIKLIRIFTAARIIIMEGYGLTETSPVISVNRYDAADRMIGSVGPLVEGVSVKIAEDGEIWCKGPNIMMGYYKLPELTAESIEDGWYKTGDIGMIIDKKFLKITDRKKEMFKTSGGKYVAPLAVEMKLRESPYIEAIMVIGAGEKYVGALIIPSFSHLADWAKRQNISYSSNEEMIQDARVKQLLKNEVETYNQHFSHVEQIKKFELLARDWSVETGELTPKLSLKRKVIMEKYKEAVRRIYA